VQSGSSGTATTSSGLVGSKDPIDIVEVRKSVRALVQYKIAQVKGLDALIENADLETLCSLLVTNLSPGYDAAALMAAALLWNKDWKGTKLNDHPDVKTTIDGVIGGTVVFTGAHFGEMKELFVFTDVSLSSSDGNPKGDIDDKFALCLLAHAARDSQLERIVVVISARQKDDNDTTMPIDVAELFTEKIGHQDTNQEVQEETDGSLVKVTYRFTNKKPSRKDLSLVVCFDHGIGHLKPDYASVKTFDQIMKPKSEQAVAVVIGPISVHTAQKLEDGSRDGKYKLVAGVSVTEGVNGGDSKINKRFNDNQGAWVLACAGGRELKNMFELTTGDTRRLLMTFPFLVKHNMASIEEVKQAHTSAWRNHLGFYKEAKPDMAFRILASNSQTTSALGTDVAAVNMGWGFEEARKSSEMLLPEDTTLFEYTGMSGRIEENPRYLEIAKRYVEWCFANLYLQVVPVPKSEVVRYMENTSNAGASVLDISTIKTMAASMADTKDEKKKKIILRVIKDVGGGNPGDNGIAVDLRAVYITSIAATYMRLLSTELLLNKLGLVDRITWTCTTMPDLDEKKNPTGLYKLVPDANRKNIVSLV
jgi:hypothetical protein